MRKRWWLCHATNFQSLMYPCFIVCRVLGLFSYKINTSTFETSKPRYILSSIVISVFSVINLVLIHDIVTSKRIFGDITWDIHAVIYYAFSNFTVIVTHVLSGPRMRLLQTIWEISSKLPPKSYQKMSRFIHVKDILSIIFRLVQLYLNFSEKILENTINFFFVLIGALTVYFALLVLQIIMMYINCVCILKACFKEINDNLMHMQWHMIRNDIEPSVPRIIYHTQSNKFLLLKLKNLKKRHMMISDTVQMLNVIFNLQLLGTIVTSFSVITFEMYFYLVRWQDGIFISLDRNFLIKVLPAIMYNGSIIMLLVWACETSKNQAREIRTTIHDLLNTTNNKKIKYELQLFSLQILHRENIFAVKGLNINATLLAAMVGCITTYLIILIQFLHMSHSCGRKTGINNN
ncbi:PREDICTED: uncharacterized protein LOC105460230 [Wasmannia auropunctata]|uniref:uncharacterized protein LOC105460230 n=1 Tax=Wasmannia auropunctata TaxID=64793 RepID=UPI0005EF4C28|nr:PREDICTED: uncharacterized protein LOC105460230 [Wasmannia auropunctata]